MPTALSSTELPRQLPRVLADFPGSLRDLRALLAMRAGSLSRQHRRRMALAGGLVLGLTVAAVVVPAYVADSLDGLRANSFVALLPSLYVGFLVLAVISSIASGGGREVVPREQTVAFPVSTWTEHFGALLLSPLNIAWLLQSWALLGATSYVLGPQNLLFSALPVLLWIVLASALGQAIGWVVEGLRRGAHGIWVMRLLVVATAVLAGWLVVTDRLVPLLDQAPTIRLFLMSALGSGGFWGTYTVQVLVLLAMTMAVVLVGGLPARWALRRPERAEARLDSGQHRARPNPAGDLRALVRIDRASVWRSVPLRRGLLVLALLPGVIAAAGALEWNMVTILPGLVASGGGLLFGVNAWALDGRGALWRDSLPADQGLALLSKGIVLAEILVASAAVTIGLASLRAGTPTAAELAATLCATVVVTLSVVSACLRWSIQRPFAVDLRSARATPAPPVVMVGYSTRLALSTTLIGLVFSGTALAANWRVPVVVAMPFLAVSLLRLWATTVRWRDPVRRSRVVATVAG